MLPADRFPPRSNGRVPTARSIGRSRAHRAPEHDMFGRLYRLMAPTVFAHVRAMVPPTAGRELIDAVVAGTFVEVCWLGRLHFGTPAEVADWICGVATRRVRDRFGSIWPDGGPAACPVESTMPIVTIHDRTTGLLLTALLDQGTR